METDILFVKMLQRVYPIPACSVSRNFSWTLSIKILLTGITQRFRKAF